MDHSDSVEVERFGGLGGFGLPGSRVRSRGVLRKLNAADREQLELLFTSKPSRQGAAASSGDQFRYQLTLRRQDGSAAGQIELSEDAVPDLVRDCVREELQ
jgi:hypothetical protein